MRPLMILPLYEASLVRSVPCTTPPLYVVSLVPRAPCTMSPIYNVSLVRFIPSMMCPSYDASLGRSPLVQCVPCTMRSWNDNSLRDRWFIFSTFVHSVPDTQGNFFYFFFNCFLFCIVQAVWAVSFIDSNGRQVLGMHHPTGTHHPKDASSQGHIIPGTHHPRDISSQRHTIIVLRDAKFRGTSKKCHITGSEMCNKLNLWNKTKQDEIHEAKLKGIHETKWNFNLCEMKWNFTMFFVLQNKRARLFCFVCYVCCKTKKIRNWKP
jgi:hypothetical protein